jgi:EF-P beta-lysylation protein EpmB
MLRTLPLAPQLSWQEQLADLITDPLELLQLLNLDSEIIGYSAQALRSFPLRVTRAYAARMQPGNPEDPLLRQVLPHNLETLPYPGFTEDPIGESQANPVKGLLHKYQGRVLLIATQTCAINCRYCFRRHFPYADNRPSRKQWQDALQYIAADASIKEVILSGGDPLATSNTYLAWLVEAIAEIPHVQRIRLHSRLPLVLPDRIDRPLQQLLGSLKQQVVFVIHANHAQEFDASVDAACQRLRETGMQLLNQSVLLRGVNDSVDTLAALSERLLAAGVLPYYLHFLDKVSGAGHFAVSLDTARALVAGLQASLPGYLVPRLVCEEPDRPGKVPL